MICQQEDCKVSGAAACACSFECAFFSFFFHLYKILHIPLPRALEPLHL